MENIFSRILLRIVVADGFEPITERSLNPLPLPSWAMRPYDILKLARVRGIEPLTYSFGDCRSTTELNSHSNSGMVGAVGLEPT